MSRSLVRSHRWRSPAGPRAALPLVQLGRGRHLVRHGRFRQGERKRDGAYDWGRTIVCSDWRSEPEAVRLQPMLARWMNS
jgi:hypothetical protein